MLPENIFAAYIFSGVTSWTHCIDSIHWQIRNISTMTGFIGYRLAKAIHKNPAAIAKHMLKQTFIFIHTVRIASLTKGLSSIIIARVRIYLWMQNAILIEQFRPSVCPSFTRWYCVKTMRSDMIVDVYVITISVIIKGLNYAVSEKKLCKYLSTPHIILASLPSFCQNLSKLV